MKKRIYSTMLAIGLSLGLLGTTAVIAKAPSNKTKVVKKVAVKNSVATKKDKDGLILFSYCYDHLLALNDSKDRTIKKQAMKGQTKYVFKDHVLSCGTYMNGYLIVKKGNQNSNVQGVFATKENPYQIKKLLVNVTVDNENTEKVTGTITVDGKAFDATLLK